MTQTSQRIDEWGRVVLQSEGLLDLFYKGLAQSPDLIAENSPEIQAYNQWCKTFDMPEKMLEVALPLDVTPDAYHAARQNEWLMPSEYLDIDIPEYLYQRCTTEPQIARVQEELALFTQLDMLPALHLFIYITESLRAAGVWWGVGRGSSVSSYCLYLIGVHKVDSLAYDLDIREFLKDVS